MTILLLILIFHFFRRKTGLFSLRESFLLAFLLTCGREQFSREEAQCWLFFPQDIYLRLVFLISCSSSAQSLSARAIAVDFFLSLPAPFEFLR